QQGAANALSQFASATEKLTLPILVTMLQAATAAIPHFTSVVAAVAPVVQTVADAFKNWVSGGGLDQFIGFIQRFGVPSLEFLTPAVRHLLAALGTGMRDFGPMGVQFASWLADITTKFRAWGDGGGFQRFLAWLHENSPQITQFLHEMGQA